MSHNWSNSWPGNVCLRCGSEQVLELALGEGWLAFDENNVEQWKSPDHKALVDLCDNFCHADMTVWENSKYRSEIKALCAKIGYPAKKVANGTQLG